MELIDFIKNFIGTETPFMILFASLFFFTIKSNREREANLNNIIENRLAAIQEEQKLLIRIWKILLEKELEAKNNEH